MYTPKQLKIRAVADDPSPQSGLFYLESQPIAMKGPLGISNKNFFQKIVCHLGRIDVNRFHTKAHVYQRMFADFIKRHRSVKLLHILRHYSALVVVISSALLVSATNVAAGKGGQSLLSGYWDEEDDQIAATSKINGQANKKNDLALVPLAKAPNKVDPEFKEDESIAQIPSQNQGIYAAALSGSPVKDPEEDGGVRLYTVQQGDTISSIASRNKITVNTILWANDIDNVDSIMPGDTLFILPVSGISYSVKSGDTIDTIASKYKADKEKIIAFNELPANGALETGEEIIIPDGQGESAPQQQQTQPSNTNTGLERRQYATSTGGAPEVSGFKKLDGKAGAGHKFPYGYCTWYVAQKRYVPWGGNAGTWLYHAKSLGYQTGKAPRPGSIMVTTESRYYGHVALVEKVSGDTITVSEMNFVGWGKVSRRTISAKSRAIKGFIY